MKKLIKVLPTEFKNEYQEYKTGDLVDIAVPQYKFKFSGYKIYRNCEVVKHNFDKKYQEWYYFKNEEMKKAKKMLGKNFCVNSKLLKKHKVKRDYKDLLKVITNKINFFKKGK